MEGEQLCGRKCQFGTNLLYEARRHESFLVLYIAVRLTSLVGHQEHAVSVTKYVESFRSGLDSLGPTGFYGESDSNMKAPLIADEYRLDICRRAQKGLFKFDHIDKFARECPNFATIDETTKYLVQIGPSELERTRVVFTWIATHIRYDWAGYCSGDMSASSTAENVFNRKAGVCGGYSLLFHKMASLAQLHPYCVSGLAAGLTPGAAPATHAWNGILIEGEMVLPMPASSAYCVLF